MNEQSSLVVDYLNWYEHGDRFDGTVFHVRGDQVTIYQPIDDEEEPDKYIIHEEDVTPGEWNALLDMIEKLTS